MHYANKRFAGYTAHEWRDNYEFESVLAIDKMQRGYSAKYLIWVDEEGHTYPMFIADLIDLLKRGVVQEGVTTPHRWTFRKRGENYGVRLADG